MTSTKWAVAVFMLDKTFPLHGGASFQQAAETTRPWERKKEGMK